MILSLFTEGALHYCSNASPNQTFGEQADKPDILEAFYDRGSP